MSENLRIEADDKGVWIAALTDDFTQPVLLEFLRLNGVSKYDKGAVENFLRAKSRDLVKIAQRSEKDESDAVISVKLSKDTMTATLTITPPFFTKPWPAESQLMDALKAKGILFGIDEGAVKTISELRVCCEDLVIAKGRPSQNGADARIELLVDPDKAPVVDEDSMESIDHRSRSAFVNVLKGQEIAIKHPATLGENGISVVGTSLPSKPGKDVSFSFGEGLKLSEGNELLLVAAVDGCLLKTKGKLTVMSELVVSSDVDFGVGNINFTGVVKIKGAVKEGFRVVSAGNIDIRETVEGAHVESGGQVIIHGGVRGMNKADIIAEGNVTIGFADQVKIRSGESIYIKDALLHSFVSARDSVVVMGGQKSQIAGGKIEAGIDVTCQILGSEMGTKTDVMVGFSPELLERRKILREQVAQNSLNLQKLDANLVFLKKLESVGQLDTQKRNIMMAATKTKFQLQGSLISMENELNEIQQRLDLNRASAAVRARDICYPGVNISIRGVLYVVQENLKYVSFVCEDDAISLKPFDYKL